jgi:hypothetical protein
MAAAAHMSLPFCTVRLTRPNLGLLINCLLVCSEHSAPFVCRFLSELQFAALPDSVALGAFVADARKYRRKVGLALHRC